MGEGSPWDKFSLSLARLSLWSILLDGDPCEVQHKEKFKDNMLYVVLVVMQDIC